MRAGLAGSLRSVTYVDDVWSAASASHTSYW